jgi:hypothetical protein
LFSVQPGGRGGSEEDEAVGAAPVGFDIMGTFEGSFVYMAIDKIGVRSIEVSATCRGGCSCVAEVVVLKMHVER